MLSYAVTLSDALTPITLISGVGLLLLAMTARYNYTTDRVRALLKERRQKAPVIDPVLEKAIRLTYERSHLLKNAILAVTTSAAFSGILVLVTILEHLLELNMEVWKSTMLLTAVVFSGPPAHEVRNSGEVPSVATLTSLTPQRPRESQ